MPNDYVPKVLSAAVAWSAFLVLFATPATSLADDRLAPFLGTPAFSRTRLFDDQRYPNVVVTLRGSVLAVWGNSGVVVRRSVDGGKSWGPPITVAPEGYHGGGTIVDETSGDILVFVEERQPPAPLTLFRSQDEGKTWRPEPTTIEKDSLGHEPSMHMNEHGITLLHGPNQGRLLRPSRYYDRGGKESWSRQYTNAVYSDDGGKTWKTSEPFPERGTGEAALVELRDGRVYYNSRVHWPERPRNRRRREAFSVDGGVTWKDWRIVDALPDGDQGRAYGCMGGLTRLPLGDRDILLFSNLDTQASHRERVTVWASFDGGKTWPLKRLVDAGRSGYSSLAVGRHGTPSEGWIYLHYEHDPFKGAHLARFNLEWILAGQATGDGELPGDLAKALAAARKRSRTAAFAHPGIAHSQASLDFVKAKLARKESPWIDAWAVLKESSYARLEWKPAPSEHVERGAYNRPDIGASEFLRDASAAYTHSLIWVLSGEEAHAKKSAEILDAWSGTLRSVKNHDARLLVGMAGHQYLNAAELLRHRWDAWPEEDQASFRTMVRGVWYPVIEDFFPTANGNWDASMLQTMIAMGVFLDDRALFDRAVTYFRGDQGNGALRNYLNDFGECQESGRDQAHTQMGLEYLANTCETVWNQGLDLYGDLDNRLLLGFEYTAKYNLGFDVRFERFRSVDGRYDHKEISSKSRGRLRPMYEKVFRHYHHRRGLDAPYTKQAIAKTRIEEGGTSSLPWGTLMYAQEVIELAPRKEPGRR